MENIDQAQIEHLTASVEIRFGLVANVDLELVTILIMNVVRHRYKYSKLNVYLYNLV